MYSRICTLLHWALSAWAEPEIPDGTAALRAFGNLALDAAKRLECERQADSDDGSRPELAVTPDQLRSEASGRCWRRRPATAADP
jgi:hypothetical protein